MKKTNNIKSFGQFNENLNISDVREQINKVKNFGQFLNEGKREKIFLNGYEISGKIQESGVIKEDEFYDDSSYEFIDAFSQGIVEHGNVIISIGGEEISLSIEESNDGTFRVFLDDMDKKDLLPSEFDGEIESELTNDEFVGMVRDFYESTAREKR